jgi:7-cyano-7-deazaguanine reductase
MNDSKYEGLQEDVRGFSTPDIEVWENKYDDKIYTITIDTTEFTCICPKTGLPDFAHIFLEYSPHKSCLELKSFKEYLLSYRGKGIFHEHVVNRILEDITKACKPRNAKVKGVFNLRGGIMTTVEAVYSEEGIG